MSIRRVTAIRSLLLVAAITYYLAGYFALNIFNAHRAHYVQLALPFEHAIPFVPLFVIPYGLVLLIIVLGFLSIPVAEWAAFRRAFVLFFVNITICFILFALVPVRDLQRPAPQQLHGWLSGVVAFVYWIDAPTNLFPSLHVNAAVLSGLVARRHHRRIGNALLVFAAVVALSTLLVKQHYVADVVSGALLAVLSELFLLRHPQTSPVGRPMPAE